MKKKSLKDFKSLLLALLIIVSSSSTFSQVQISGNLTTYIDDFIASLPSTTGGNQYQIPSTTDITIWANTINYIMQGNYSAGNLSADSIGYRIVQYTDNSVTPNITYWVLEKKSTSVNYWGTFIYNPNALRRQLFIQSPHPVYDQYTGKQGFYIFSNQSCRAFFVTGTHRCNSSVASVCNGTTSVCGNTAPYKISDQAHAANGTLQKTTEVLLSYIPNLVAIQPHGFARLTGDPDMIMSNGTRVTPATDYLVALRDNLAIVDPTLTFKLIHIDLTWSRLAATENVQGRLINGSSDPCSQAAAAGNGRFIHVEQAYTSRSTEAERKKLSDAIGLTFPLDGITLTSLNGNQSITAGSIQNITWSTTNVTVNHLKIDYSINNGSTWNTIAANTTNTGSYAWTVPNIGTWRAKVRVLDLDNSSLGDTSTSVFKIIYAVYPTTGTTTAADAASAFGPRKLSGIYDFHRGIDFPGTYNTPIHPSLPGVIVRKEDSTITAGTGLQRSGNWLLVRVDSVAGEPFHNAYLHLNSFSKYNVGDTVSTADTIGFMGKSGYEINTVHLHFELYDNLLGTAIDKDKAINPIKVLPYSNLNSYQISFLTSGDSSAVQITTNDTELDIDEVIINGSITSRTIGFNARTGIDPVNNDNPYYNNVSIDPDQFLQDSTRQTIRFWVKNNVIGLIASVKLTDVNGYSVTQTQAAFGRRYAVASGNWNGAIWASTAAGVAGSASVPIYLNDVTINSNVTVTINTSTAECDSVSFAATTSKISFAAASQLSVYGNFTLASSTHNAFSAWVAGAKIRFTGSGTQILSGWSTTSGAFTTSMVEMIVDKPVGTKVKTAGADQKFNIGTSLEIISGTFELTKNDDIECFGVTGTASTPSITVQANGTFDMNSDEIVTANTQYIRKGNTSGTFDLAKIGNFVVYGTAKFAPNSSNRLNFSSLSIENGGVVEMPAVRNTVTSAGYFNAGPITIKSGGKFKNSITNAFWYINTTTPSSVTINSGGVYEVSAASTSVANVTISQSSGSMFRYSSDIAATLPASITNYKNLILSGSGVKTLGANTTINESLQLSGSFTTLGLSTFTLTYNPLAILRYGETGQQLSQTTTNTEWPAANGPLNVQINNSGGVTLHSSRALTGTLTLTNGFLLLGNNNLTMGASSTFAGTPSSTNMIITNGTGNLIKSIANSPALPYSIVFPIGENTESTDYSPVTLNITSGNFNSASISARVVNSKHPSLSSNAVDYLNRYWVLSSAGISSAKMNITGAYQISDITGSESNLYSIQNTNGQWTKLSPVNSSLHEISGTGVSSLSDFTGSGLDGFGITMNITFIPEGYYRSDTSPLPVSDTFQATLASTVSPNYADIETVNIKLDSVSFTGTATFSTAPSGVYYLYIKGMSLVSTWTASPIALSQCVKFSYNFTSGLDKAYSIPGFPYESMILKGTKWCIYNGDVDQDELIGNIDLVMIDNDAYNVVETHGATDLDGDSFVGNVDLTICDNHAFWLVESQSPRKLNSFNNKNLNSINAKKQNQNQLK